MQKRIIIFDLDGTLIDSKKIYIDTIHQSLLQQHYVYPKTKISEALGPKIEITLKNISKFSSKIIKKLKDNINNNISKKVSEIRLAPYTRKILKKLNIKGYKMFILTNSSRKFVNAIMKRNKLKKYFTKIFYAENFSSKENAIKKIAKKYKTNVSDIIYIADKVNDVKIAKKVGCKIIIVLACSWDKSKLIKEKSAVNSLKDIEI